MEVTGRGDADSDGNSALGCWDAGCIDKAQLELCLASFKVCTSPGDPIGARALAFLTGSATL